MWAYSTDSTCQAFSVKCCTHSVGPGAEYVYERVLVCS